MRGMKNLFVVKLSPTSLVEITSAWVYISFIALFFIPINNGGRH